MMVRTNLPAELSSPRGARDFVGGALHAWCCDSVVDPVKLIASELVANAVRHAGTEVEVDLERRDDAIRLGVSDQSDEMPVPQNAPVDAVSGRGLSVVSALSVVWGVELLPRGKRVWADVLLTSPC